MRDPLAIVAALREALPTARLTEAELLTLLRDLDAAARMARQRLAAERKAKA